MLWRSGSTHTISVASPQTGSDGNQYAFSIWSDGGAVSHTVTASHAVTTYTATLAEQFTVSGQVTLGGAGLQGVIVTLIPTAGGQSPSTTTDANGNYSIGGTAGLGYTVTPSFMSYTFSQPFSVGSLSVSLSGVNFSVTGGSGVTAGPGGQPQPPTLPPATVTPPSPVTTTYQACTDITGVWDDPNLVDPSGEDITWLLAQNSDNSVTGHVVANYCGPVVWDVTGSINTGGAAVLTATPEVSTACENLNPPYTVPGISLQATVGCSTASVSSDGATIPTSNMYPQARSQLKPLTRKSFPSGITMTLDINNANPGNQLSVTLTDPTVSQSGLSVSRTGNLLVTMSGILSMGYQGPMQPITLIQQNGIAATNNAITASYNLRRCRRP